MNPGADQTTTPEAAGPTPSGTAAAAAPDPDGALRRYRQRADRFAAVVAGADGHWDVATPCPRWSAGDVVDHVVDTERDFLDQHGLLTAPAPDRADRVGAWHRHVAAVSEVFSRPGVAGTRYDGYFGPTTLGETLADFYGWDLLVHGWDLARVTGQRYDLEAEVGWLDAAADGWGEALRMEGICGPAVPVAPDASAQERLLARLGRDPHWSA